VTLLHLHQDDATRLAGALAAAFGKLCAAIIAAITRLFEHMLDDGEGEGEQRSFDSGAACHPQQPLLLDDKWDF
jgi:hypothetical protein